MPKQIILTLEDNGQLNLQGPIENSILCYGMLEVAKDILRDFQTKKRDSRIEVPQLELPIGLRS